MSRVWTDEECAWLRKRWPGCGNVNDALDAFEAEFGRRPTKHAIQQKAHTLGLGKRDNHPERERRAAVRMRWSDPAFADMKAWMLEHDVTESVWPTIDAFEAEFGIRLTRGQVVCFRQLHGTQRCRSRKGGRTPRPLGSEIERKDGYVYVKVREEPQRPGTRDNWELKQHVAWSEAHGGAPVPEGHVVYFADRDIRNFDPENLVLVPRWMVARLNAPETPDYSDAATLEAAMAWIRLHSAVCEVEHSKPRRCGVCGAEFVEDERQRKMPKPAQTCRACLDKGFKAKGERTPKGEAACKVCGAEFVKRSRHQVRCPACIAKGPKRSANQQKRKTKEEER